MPPDVSTMSACRACVIQPGGHRSPPGQPGTATATTLQAHRRPPTPAGSPSVTERLPRRRTPSESHAPRCAAQLQHPGAFLADHVRRPHSRHNTVQGLRPGDPAPPVHQWDGSTTPASASARTAILQPPQVRITQRLRRSGVRQAPYALVAPGNRPDQTAWSAPRQPGPRRSTRSCETSRNPRNTPRCGLFTARNADTNAAPGGTPTPTPSPAHPMQFGSSNDSDPDIQRIISAAKTPSHPYRHAPAGDGLFHFLPRHGSCPSRPLGPIEVGYPPTSMSRSIAHPPFPRPA